MNFDDWYRSMQEMIETPSVNSAYLRAMVKLGYMAGYRDATIEATESDRQHQLMMLREQAD